MAARRLLLAACRSGAPIASDEDSRRPSETDAVVEPRTRSEPEPRLLVSVAPSGRLFGMARSRPSSDRFDVLALWLNKEEGEEEADVALLKREEVGEVEESEPEPRSEPVPLE